MKHMRKREELAKYRARLQESMRRLHPADPARSWAHRIMVAQQVLPFRDQVEQLLAGAGRPVPKYMADSAER